jgi:hypothetical protein
VLQVLRDVGGDELIGARREGADLHHGAVGRAPEVATQTYGLVATVAVAAATCVAAAYSHVTQASRPLTADTRIGYKVASAVVRAGQAASSVVERVKDPLKCRVPRRRVRKKREREQRARHPRHRPLMPAARNAS